jgi:hypothetical protein
MPLRVRAIRKEASLIEGGKTVASGRDKEGSRRGQRLMVWSGAACLMLLPVIAIRGTDSAAWRDNGDLVFLAILLWGVGIAYEVAARVRPRNAYKAGAGIALAAALLNVWLNLAVGIIGSEGNLANLLYGAVLAVAGVGASISRFRPGGMAAAMIAAAMAQASIFVIALAAGMGFTGPITIFFTALWLLAAWSFAKARQQ